MKWFAVLAVVLALGVAEAAEIAAPEDTAVLYERRCGLCHGPKGWATEMLGKKLGETQAQLADRSNLSEAYIRLVVRQGVTGMPTMRQAELSEGDLVAIIRYLTGDNE